MAYRQEREPTPEELAEYHAKTREQAAALSEAGTPTQWDVAWREGYTKALETVLGVGYRRAYNLACGYWRPRAGWRTRLARRLLGPTGTGDGE